MKKLPNHKAYKEENGSSAFEAKTYSNLESHRGIKSSWFGIWQFLIKFTKEQNMIHVLYNGPWFILNSHLSVQRWETKFVASQAKVTFTVIWLRLSKLPSEFYDMDILHKVGQKVGNLLKIYACTSTTTRERYAHLCVQVLMEHPLVHHVYIGSHKQVIHYDGFNLLFTTCGQLGHQAWRCAHTPQVLQDKP